MIRVTETCVTTSPPHIVLFYGSEPEQQQFSTAPVLTPGPVGRSVCKYLLQPRATPPEFTKYSHKGKTQTSGSSWFAQVHQAISVRARKVFESGVITYLMGGSESLQTRRMWSGVGKLCASVALC